MEIVLMMSLPQIVAAWISARRGHHDYAMIVCVSTLTSVAWYGAGAHSEGILWQMDHSMAGLWGVIDLFTVPPSIFANIILIIINLIMTNPDWRYIWYMIYGLKTIIVAALLPKRNYTF